MSSQSLSEREASVLRAPAANQGTSRLYEGDILYVDGEPARYDAEGKLLLDGFAG